MLFRLSYITRDYLFGDAEIRASDPDKGIQVIYKNRPKDGEKPPYQAYDGLIVATCERTLAQRLHSEAVSSGVLSRNKEAVQKIFDQMQDAFQRTPASCPMENQRHRRSKHNSHGNAELFCVNFGLPSNTVMGSGFGVISRTAGTSRQIQFSLKLIFRANPKTPISRLASPGLAKQIVGGRCGL
jgi:hypothetical protein